MSSNEMNLNASIDMDTSVEQQQKYEEVKKDYLFDTSTSTTSLDDPDAIDSNKQLTTLFRTIFDKCLKTENELEFSSITINETSSTTATTTRSSSSRARCKDLIECLTSEINHTHNQHAIDCLKVLFREHFNNQSGDDSFLRCDLEFSEFNQILQKWVCKLNEMSINNNTNESSAAVSINNSKRGDLSCKKKQQLKHTSSRLMDALEDYCYSSSQSLSSSSSSSSQLPLTNNPVLLSKSTSSIQSDYESTSSHHGNETLDELKQVNLQLRQYLSDLKLQLEHCEETNAQLVNDLDECQQRKQTELSRLEKELRMQVDENDQLKRASEYLRHKISDMSSENAFLNTNLKDSMSKLETYEHQFNTMQSQAQSDKLEMKKLLHELKNEKTKLANHERMNTNLEQQVNEMLQNLKDQTQSIENLNDSLKECKLENENLTEIVNKLDESKNCPCKSSWSSIKAGKQKHTEIEINLKNYTNHESRINHQTEDHPKAFDNEKNEKNFFIEQFEHEQNLLQFNAKQENYNGSNDYCNSELALVIDYFKDYVILLDEIIKLKLNERNDDETTSTIDKNNNNSFDSKNRIEPDNLNYADEDNDASDNQDQEYDDDNDGDGDEDAAADDDNDDDVDSLRKNQKSKNNCNNNNNNKNHSSVRRKSYVTAVSKINNNSNNNYLIYCLKTITTFLFYYLINADGDYIQPTGSNSNNNHNNNNNGNNKNDVFKLIKERFQSLLKRFKLSSIDLDINNEKFIISENNLRKATLNFANETIHRFDEHIHQQTHQYSSSEVATCSSVQIKSQTDWHKISEIKQKNATNSNRQQQQQVVEELDNTSELVSSASPNAKPNRNCSTPSKLNENNCSTKITNCSKKKKNCNFEAPISGTLELSTCACLANKKQTSNESLGTIDIIQVQKSVKKTKSDKAEMNATTRCSNKKSQSGDTKTPRSRFAAADNSKGFVVKKVYTKSDNTGTNVVGVVNQGVDNKRYCIGWLDVTNYVSSLFEKISFCKKNKRKSKNKLASHSFLSDENFKNSIINKKNLIFKCSINKHTNSTNPTDNYLMESTISISPSKCITAVKSTDNVKTILKNSSKKFQHQINIQSKDDPKEQMLAHHRFKPVPTTSSTVLNHKMRKINSLPSLFDEKTMMPSSLPKKFLTKDTETQTSDLDLDIMGASCSSSSTSSSSSGYNYFYGQQQFLKQQLTRDSGIDSDHAINSNTQNKLGDADKHLTVVPETIQTPTPTNQPLKFIISSGSEEANAVALSTSTRDNSVENDQEFGGGEGGGARRIHAGAHSLSIDDADCLNFDDFCGFDELSRMGIQPSGTKCTSSSFDGATNRRQMFKNSYNKHHTIAVSSSILTRPKQISLDKKLMIAEADYDSSTKDCSIELNNINLYNKHLDEIRSSKPIIEFTSLSKFASHLRQNENESLKSAINLSIDDYLNTNLPIPRIEPEINSQSATNPVKQKLTDNLNRRRQTLSNLRAKSMLTRPSSICLTDYSASSFDDMSSTSNIDNDLATSSSSADSSDCDEHRLKLLESNFNQISIGHHTDEKLIEMCLEKYKEKFFKTDAYLSFLYDEINNFLNKLVNCLNDLNKLDKEGYPNNGTYSCLSKEMAGASNVKYSSLDDAGNNSCSIDTASDIDPSALTFSKANKKFLQDNLNNLNKTVTLARKSMIDLIITSTMIGGLKQESHLSELVKISISYVKELKKSFLKSTTASNNKITNNHILLAANGSIGNHFAPRPLLKRSLTINPTSNSMPCSHITTNRTIRKQVQPMCQDEVEQKETPQIRTHSNLIQTSEEVSQPKKNWLATSIKLLKSMKTATINQPTTVVVTNVSSSPPKVIIKSPEEEEAEYELSEQVKTEKEQLQHDDQTVVASEVIVENGKNKYISNARQYLGKVEKYFSQLPSLIKKDSFKFLRFSISCLIFIFSLIFFLLTFFQDEDFYENFFNLIKNHVFVNNPTNTVRAS